MRLLNVVLLAQNYESLIQWYQDVFELELVWQQAGEYHYTELGLNQKAILGISPAKELKHEPNQPKNNSCLMQLEVEDIKACNERVLQNHGKILFGPSYEEENQFYYGGIEDCEGNQIWLNQFKKNPVES